MKQMVLPIKHTKECTKPSSHPLKEDLFMRLFPKEENFFNYFEELANKIEEGGQFFLEMTKNRDYSAAKVSRLKELEHEADGITHKTYERMHKTFLTPIDREDIYALVNKMDSIMDVIEATAIRIHMYKVKKPDDEIIKQAEILFQAIKKMKGIVHGLRNMKNSQMILDGCVEIHTLENAGDVVLRTIITDLFIKEKDAIELIKWKEIFERIEEAIDVCENVSNIVEGIVLKHA
jgi:predicted phosphate transport protein (TIGR00153 family)